MKINLNSPNGNIFKLLVVFTSLMKEAEFSQEEIIDFRRALMNSKYDDSINRIKNLCPKLSEKLGQQIEIYFSENYEMR